MTEKELNTILNSSGIPFRYYQFKSKPPNPYGVYLCEDAEHVFADGVTALQFDNIRIELYTDEKSPETEKQLTDAAIIDCKSLTKYEKDFVVLAMYGASVGNVSISKIDAYTNQACCAMKLQKNNDNRYLYYFLRAAQEEMLLKAFGGTQPNISQVIVKNLNFLDVPYAEQLEISIYLDQKCEAIDALLSAKNQQLDKLIAHKKSLIYEYVTGKKRVTEVN